MDLYEALRQSTEHLFIKLYDTGLTTMLRTGKMCVIMLYVTLCYEALYCGVITFYVCDYKCVCTVIKAYVEHYKAL